MLLIGQLQQEKERYVLLLNKPIESVVETTPEKPTTDSSNLIQCKKSLKI